MNARPSLLASLAYCAELDRLWDEVNALTGNCPKDDYERGYGDAIDAVLTLLEKRDAKHPALRPLDRAAIRSVALDDGA